MQQEITFPTNSPINELKLGNQNCKVFEHLKSGKTINRNDAYMIYGIGNLHSRISDLSNVHKIEIYSRFITVIDRFNNKVTCKEYSLNPFNE